MCGIVDDLLPVIGSIAGFALGGPWGAAAGGALGGSIGNYAQTHNWGSAALGGVTGGIGGYFGGGSLANALQGIGQAGVGATSAAFDTGLASSTAPTTLGGLEGAAGGAAMFGPAAGTGTAIGSAAAGLGGGGLGEAGAGALSGVTDTGLGYLGGLGGGTQGTGLGLGTSLGGQAGLTGAEAATSGGGITTGLGQGVGQASPVSTLGQTNATNTGVLGTQPTTPIGTGTGLEGSQVATTGSGAPVAFNSNSGTALEGAQAATQGGGQSGTLAAMYGPTSTAPASPIGQGIAGTQVEVPGASNVQFGALGEGTPAAPGVAATGATTGGAKVGENLMSMYQQYAPWMRLANTGLNAYQQYAQQQAQNRYADQINQMFAPNSPYAQQMQQTLARQDAAAGRNSQYGNRAVQLAAALTQARAQALGNQNYYRAATATPGASMLNGLFANFSSPQGIQQLGQIGSAGLNGLQSLFGG